MPAQSTAPDHYHRASALYYDHDHCAPALGSQDDDNDGAALIESPTVIDHRASAGRFVAAELGSPG